MTLFKKWRTDKSSSFTIKANYSWCLESLFTHCKTEPFKGKIQRPLAIVYRRASAAPKLWAISVVSENP